MPIGLKNGIPWMDPGKLRHRVMFLDQVISEDVSGTAFAYAAGSPPEFADAEIVYVRGTDKIKAGQDVAQVSITLTMRYRASVTAKRRVQAPNGSQYVIQAVENIAQMNMWMELTCLGIAENA